MLDLENIRGEIKKLSRWTEEPNGHRDTDRGARGEAEAVCLCTLTQRVHACAHECVQLHLRPSSPPPPSLALLFFSGQAA